MKAEHRTPKELIEMYWERVWNNREAELIREICADPIYRHDPGSTTALSHDEQVNRVKQQSERGHPQFSHEVLLADDEYVCSVWNVVTTRGSQEVKFSGIEVFRAENGRLTNCWNSSYTKGFWGRIGDKSVPDDLPPPQLLNSVDQITKDWIQQALQHGGIDAPKLSMVANKPIGAGSLSNTVQTRVTYNADARDFPRTVICKFHPASEVPAQIAKRLGASTREVQAARTLAKHSYAYTPKVIWANCSESGEQMNLVMEDLSHFKLGDQVEGCSIEQAEAVTDAFIALHGLHWNDQQLGQQEWLLHRDKNAEGLGGSYKRGCEDFHQRFTGRLSEEDFSMIDALVPLITDAGRFQSKYRCLVHGEPRVDNIIFDMTADKPKAYLIDWQFADFANPMFDLAYLVSGSLTIEDRRKSEKELVTKYSQAIQALAPDYSSAQAKEDFAFNLLFGLSTTVSAARSVPPGEAEDKLLITLAERNCAAIRDWDALAVARQRLGK